LQILFLRFYRNFALTKSLRMQDEEASSAPSGRRFKNRKHGSGALEKERKHRVGTGTEANSSRRSAGVRAGNEGKAKAGKAVRDAGGDLRQAKLTFSSTHTGGGGIGDSVSSNSRGDKNKPQHASTRPQGKLMLSAPLTLAPSQDVRVQLSVWCFGSRFQVRDLNQVYLQSSNSLLAFDATIPAPNIRLSRFLLVLLSAEAGTVHRLSHTKPDANLPLLPHLCRSFLSPPCHFVLLAPFHSLAFARSLSPESQQQVEVRGRLLRQRCVVV
jgi:hypothetical protein